VLTGLLGSSKQLVTALEKADWLDRILIFAGLAFFILVVLFILKQRVLDRGLRVAFWWTRFLSRGDSQLNVKQEMMEKGVTITQSLAAVASSVVASTAPVLASQVAHAAGSDWDGPSSSTPGGHVHEKVSHIFPDPDTIDSSLLATTTTLPMHEPPTTDSIHDEL
jgi:protein transport protein SEC20